jgi:hypothetical protein
VLLVLDMLTTMAARSCGCRSKARLRRRRQRRRRREDGE